MTYQSDGKYSFKVDVNNTGELTVQILLYNIGILVVNYPNTEWTPPENSTSVNSVMYEDWDSDELFEGYSNDVSIEYVFMLKAPATDDFKFYLYSTEDAKLYIDSVLK
mmetsp:Transcript_9311/g.10465  ORF Transcript_9311/g.10465 Transcript_9311/m.10465 type:complete len:108 (+) Transcript_9311:199-522(+)